MTQPGTRSAAAAVKVWGWFRLPHPFPSVLVAGTGLAFAVLATPHRMELGDAFRLFAMLLSSQLSVGAFNDYCDAESDRLAKPWKPIPSHAVPRRGALLFAGSAALAGLGLAWSFGPLTFALNAAAAATGLVYDYPLKGTSWSWAPYVVGVPLLPLLSWSAVGVLPWGAAWAYPIGALLALALHVANALPDEAGDRAAGVAGLASRLGRRRSLRLLYASVGGAVLLAGVALGSVSSRPAWAVPAVLIAVALSTAALTLSHRDDVVSGRRAFALLAIGSAVLAVGLAAALAAPGPQT